jgi:hypothetical protein
VSVTPRQLPTCEFACAIADAVMQRARDAARRSRPCRDCAVAIAHEVATSCRSRVCGSSLEKSRRTMNVPSTSTIPVEYPSRHAVARRRHRFITLPSTSLLVVCMFLPTIRVCHTESSPIEWPWFWTPYVVAALVFAAALTRPQALWGMVLALRIILGATLGGWAVIAFGIFSFADAEPTYALAGLLACAIIAALVVESRLEVMIARIGAATAAGTIWWSYLLVSSSHALWGAHVSLGASIAMAVGCAWWWYEAETSG